MVLDYDNPTVNATSANPFAIKGKITVNYPNASSGNWTVNWPQYVNWTPTGNYTESVIIEYHNGTGWNSLGTHAPGTNGQLTSFALTGNVPNDITAAAKVRVKTNEANSSINVNNESNTFRIIGTLSIGEPASGNTLYVNDTSKYINWTTNGSVTPIDMIYSVNNGGGWYDIERNYAVSGGTGEHSYNWNPIPDRRNESSCVIKIMHNMTGMSDINNTSATFSILPVINVTKPQPPTNVYAGSTNATINWTYTGQKMTNVDIFFINSTGQWQFIKTTSVGSTGNGSTTWTPAPSYKKANSQIKVWNNETNNVSNTSGLFDIVGSIGVTAPNGGQNWPVGTSQLIAWTRDSVSIVNIYFSVDSGLTWIPIRSDYDTTGTTQFEWNISNDTKVTNGLYAKVEDKDAPIATNATSAAASAILSVFDITSPENTSDYVVAGGSKDITWNLTPTGTNASTSVILQYTTNGGGSWSDIPGANTTSNDGCFTWSSICGTVLSNQTRVRVIQSDNYNSSNESEHNFELRGNLIVNYPNNTANRTVNNPMPINWTRVGNISTVKIDYSYNGGTSWKTIDTNINASNQTYTWNIDPDENTTVIGKIKITDTNNPNTYNISPGNFSIKGTLNVDAPDGGEVLVYNGTSNASINWTKQGTMENVSIYYSTNSGSSWSFINNTTAPSLKYNWTIPNNITGNLLVRVQDQDDPTVNDTSNGTFGIKGSILLTYPNGGGNWTVGSADYVNWTPTGNYSTNVIIEYYNGTGWNTLGDASPGNTTETRSFALPSNVPDDIAVSAKARVRTNETNASINVNDDSNSTFRIRGILHVDVPNTATTWYVDQDKTINWTATGNVTPVLIQYSTNGTGGPWYNINGSYNATSGVNSYPWKVESRKNDSTCYVRVTHNISGMEDITDMSDTAFTIFPQITVTEPANNSSHVVENATTPIQWSYTGSNISSVDIYYRQNASSSWEGIDYDVDIDEHDTYIWPSVPVLRTTSAQVRVYDNATHAVYGTSNPFNIIGWLNLTAPNMATEKWIILTNSSQVTWQSQAVPTVKIYYSLNGSGGSWVYSTSASGVSSANFSVPENCTNNASIMITDSSNEGVTYDISENNFTFKEDFHITSPKDHIELVCGELTDITWTRMSANALPKVKLEFYNGASWSLIDDNASNSAGEYPDWDIPDDVISTQCKIKVSSLINSDNNNESTPAFTIKGNISITSPNTGDESWNVGASPFITWSYIGPIQNVTIWYNWNGTNAADWTPIYTRVPAGEGGSGSWEWPINDSIPLSTTARIKIFDSNQNHTNDTNDFNFTVKGALDLTHPIAGGIVMKVGETYNITWQKYGAITQVNLSYSNNSDTGPWKPIISNLNSVPSYYNTWEVPDDIGKTLKVKVQDASNVNVWNISSNNFTIVGKITLKKPLTSGEPDWIVGNWSYINWTPTGTFTSVRIEGSTNGFENESTTWTINTVPAGGNGTNQTYNYTPIQDKISRNVRIRLSDADPDRFALVNDTSTSSFVIKGNLSVASPNTGSEIWIAGTKPTITWVRAGSIQNISLRLSDGSGWPDIASVLLGSPEYNASSYSNWTVPDTSVKATPQAKVNITDVNDSSVTDESNSTFLVRGALAITNPSIYGERILANTTYDITWIKTGLYNPDNVKIEYQVGNSSWQVVYSETQQKNGSSIDAGASPFEWSVPGSQLSNDVKVRITRLADEINVPIAMTQPFAIAGNITVSEPQSGRKWAVSSTNYIKWTTKGNIENVSIYWSNTNPASWQFIGYDNGSIGNTTGHQWIIPADDPTIMSANCTIKVSNSYDEATNDTSENFSIIPRFQILTPASSQLLYANRPTYITWNKYGDVQKVNLYWSKTNFTEGLGTPIEANVSNNQNYSWSVPDDLNNTVRVRITYPDDEAATNVSPVFSRIVPLYEVVSPYSATYDIWAVGTTRQVKWKCSSANAPLVNINYTTNGTNYDYTIKEGANNSGEANATREWNWTVKDNITGGFRVMIQDVASGRTDISATSPSNSKIVGYFNLTYPNGGGNQNFTVNDTVTIAWAKNGSVANAKLEIAKNDDWNNATVINESVSNTGVYPGYRISDIISDYVKIRVADASDPEANDTSDDYFKVHGAIDLTAPEAGERLAIGYDSTLRWNTTGNISKVNIIAYSSLGAGDPRFPYTLSEPYNISINETNNGNNETAYNWTVPDAATDNLLIRVYDSGDDTIYSETAGNLSIVGAFDVISPNGNETWFVGDTHNITWFPTGTSITEVKLSYSSDSGNSWTPIEETYNNTYLGYPANITINASGIITVLNNDTVDITSFPRGSSFTDVKAMYSLNNGISWARIMNNSINLTNVTIEVIDGIVPNTGNVTNNRAWAVPDAISNFTLIKIEDRFDKTVNDTSDDLFKIKGKIGINSPVSTDRWVTRDNKTISWTPTGSVGRVNVYYSRDNFTNDTQSIILNRSNASVGDTFRWSIPDPIDVYNINSSALPVPIRVKVADYNDPTVNTTSDEFNLDYYNITWYVRDFLSNLQVTTGLSVNDTSNWSEGSLASPLMHKTPYGSFQATWTHKDFGDATEKYDSDNDKSRTVYLESKIVHVWEAKTEYSYEPSTDKLNFRSYLVRDGSIAGARDENGTFYTIATNCSIEIYYPNGTSVGAPGLNSSSTSSAGFFTLEWPSTGLNTSIVYSGITQIETAVGGRFRTPFAVNMISTVLMSNVSELVNTRINVPLTQIQEEINSQLSNQTQLIDTKMNLTVDTIKNASRDMQDAVNSTLSNFTTQTYQAIEDLQEGANQSIAAGQQSLQAAGVLEETASRFAWKGTVSPDPVMQGDNITVSIQGPGELRGVTPMPLLDIYSWDNEQIVKAVFANDITLTTTNTTINGTLVQVKSALYIYKIRVNKNDFDTGKAYSYIVSDTVTGGMVTGSGMVESTSLSAIIGLAAAAPEAERAAKKALEGIKALEAVLITKENVNIALTLKNLKESVDALPSVMAKEGSPKDMSKTINNISERLTKLIGEEGYDLKEMLGETLKDNPTLKEVRNKTEAIGSAVDLTLQIMESKFGGVDTPIVSTSLQPGSVRFRITAANPSRIKAQKVEIKNYLPQEVKPDDVADLGGLELEYDAGQSIYYVYKEIELAPGEIRMFEVEVNDIWFIPENKLDDTRKRVDSIMNKLEKTEYYQKAKEIADTIYPRLDKMAVGQADESVSRSQHIGIYRQNLISMDTVKDDIARMEKILVTAGGPPAPEMLAKTKIKADEPTKTMTWIVIFIIIIFIALMAGVLFFTWQRQTHATKEALMDAKKSAFLEHSPDEESEKKDGK
jgi:hypothetical protein